MRAVESIRLRCFPRVHVGLFDCGTATARLFGGLGFGVEGPEVVLEGTAAEEFALELPGVDARGRLDVQSVVERFSALVGLPRARVALRSSPEQHVGLGTKTALLLGVASLLDRLAGSELERRRLVELTGRGGTSGVGVHTFFTGGWVIDGGHKRVETADLLPSSAQVAPSPAPALFQHPMPANWCVSLFLPGGRRLHGADEQLFFQRNTPVPREHILEVIALAYHGVAPGIVEGDLLAVRDACRQIQMTGFKQREVGYQGPQVGACIERLYQDGAVAGMSSLGPLVYALDEMADDVPARRSRVASEVGGRYLGTFSGANTGARWENR